MESRRQYTRIYLSLPMEFHVQVVDSNQFWESRATLKNISKGGLYFECGTAPQLKRGNVAEFTFTTDPAKFGFVQQSHQDPGGGEAYRSPSGGNG